MSTQIIKIYSVNHTRDVATNALNFPKVLVKHDAVHIPTRAVALTGVPRIFTSQGSEGLDRDAGVFLGRVVMDVATQPMAELGHTPILRPICSHEQRQLTRFRAVPVVGSDQNFAEAIKLVERRRKIDRNPRFVGEEGIHTERQPQRGMRVMIANHVPYDDITMLFEHSMNASNQCAKAYLGDLREPGVDIQGMTAGRCSVGAVISVKCVAEVQKKTRGRGRRRANQSIDSVTGQTFSDLEIEVIPCLFCVRIQAEVRVTQRVDREQIIVAESGRRSYWRETADAVSQASEGLLHHLETAVLIDAGLHPLSAKDTITIVQRRNTFHEERLRGGVDHIVIRRIAGDRSAFLRSSDRPLDIPNMNVQSLGGFPI